MREDICIYLGPADRARLERLMVDRNTPQKHLASPDRAAQWRRRRHHGDRAPDRAVEADGLALAGPVRSRGYRRPAARQDAPARPQAAGGSVVQQVVTKTTTETPPAATHWTARAMARRSASPFGVQRIWAHGLKPHLVRRFKLSNDPLSRRRYDIVGLYINPPDRALVLAWTRRAKSKPSTAPSRGCR